MTVPDHVGTDGKHSQTKREALRKRQPVQITEQCAYDQRRPVVQQRCIQTEACQVADLEDRLVWHYRSHHGKHHGDDKGQKNMFADCPTNTADLTQSTETARCSLGDVVPHGDVGVNTDDEVADTAGW